MERANGVFNFYVDYCVKTDTMLNDVLPQILKELHSAKHPVSYSLKSVLDNNNFS